MKRFSLLPLVAVVFAVACTDATSPANSHALLIPKDPALAALGDPPPPPVDAAINITVSSVTVTAAFNGVYFSNGTTAWLRFDNNQPNAFGSAASANARFKRSDDKLSGMGTLVINGHVVMIDEVTQFIANPSCGTSTSGEPCATITFTATVDGQPGRTGTAEAFNRASCTFENGEGGGFFFCGGG